MSAQPGCGADLRKGLEDLTRCAFEAVARYDPRIMEFGDMCYPVRDADVRIRSLAVLVLSNPTAISGLIDAHNIEPCVDLPDSWDADPDEWCMRRI